MLILAADTPNPVIPDWTEVIVGLIAFGILYWVLSRTAFPMFERVYAQRREAIEGGMERAEAAQVEAQRTLEAYREQLADARHEANRIREEAYTQARAIEQDSRERAQQEFSRIVNRGEEQLASERSQLLVSLRAEIGQLSLQLAEKLVGESLTDESLQDRVVDRFLDGLEAGVAATGEQT